MKIICWMIVSAHLFMTVAAAAADFVINKAHDTVINSSVGESMEVRDSQRVLIRNLVIKSLVLHNSTAQSIFLQGNETTQETTVELHDSVVEGDVIFSGLAKGLLVLKGKSVVNGDVRFANDGEVQCFGDATEIKGKIFISRLGA